jgi:predicted Zn-dependent peptidase
MTDIGIGMHKLSNGIPVVTEYLPGVPSATVGVWVNTGAIDDDDCPGISHFIEHMFFKGTENRNYMQIGTDIEKLGSAMNAFTSKEVTCYHVKSISENLHESVEVLADMLMASTFPEDELLKEKGVVLEEIKMTEDMPEDFGHELLTSHVFGDAKLANKILGSAQSVTAITRDDILRYKARRYCTNTIFIACAGMFDEAGLLAELERHFGSLTGMADERVYVPAAPTPQKSFAERDIEQAHVFFGAKCCAHLDSDRRAVDIYARILGGGMTSRLFNAVREEKGLAYNVYAADTPYLYDGQFVIYAGVAQDKVQAASDAIAEELVKLAGEPVSEEELARAKTQFKGSYIFQQENNAHRMRRLGYDAIVRDRVRTVEEVIAEVDTVTADDVLRIAKRYADLAQYSAVVVSGKETDVSTLFA